MPVPRLNDESRRAFLGCRRQVSLAEGSGEVQIVYNLGMGRVHYSSRAGYLYFSKSLVGEIRGTIEAVHAGLQQMCAIEPVYLDVHRCFLAANRVRLTSETLVPVCVALRMQGIHVTTG
jgi:hypothetical protein